MIELRWLKKKETDTFSMMPSDTKKQPTYIDEKVLQMRQQTPHIGEDDKGAFITWSPWSEWQDIPVVEEE